MKGHATAIAIVLILAVLAGVIVGLTRPVSPPAPPPACAEGSYWIRHVENEGRASMMSGTAWCSAGQRVEVHEHASGAVYAVCRCPEAGR